MKLTQLRYLTPNFVLNNHQSVCHVVRNTDFFEIRQKITDQEYQSNRTGNRKSERTAQLNRT